MRRRSLRIGALMCATVLGAGTLVDAAPTGGVGDDRGGEVEVVRGAPVDVLLQSARGPQQVLVRLAARPVSRRGSASTLAAQQDAVVAAAERLPGDVVELGRLRNVLNGVFLEIDARQIAALARDPRVLSISKVRDYELMLDETVPYIGAAAVQDTGFDGSGVRVAVLDSGVDYTHAALGGPGTREAYADAYGASLEDPKNTTLDGLFPTAKVIGGYDFVGESWPTAPVTSPDPDPIDHQGHGTHVADIIAGTKGVAPGASIYAVKVCSASDSACSGVALLQGMDFALDPNDDGNLSDRADIINMSLGLAYGQAFDDDLAAAVENATLAGSLTVAASGNDGDRPFVTSTPAAAPSAMSVAQTAVPSEKVYQLSASLGARSASYLAVHQPWTSFPMAPVIGPLQYGDGSGGNLLGCDSFPANSLAGRVVLVDRGDCTFESKIRNIAAGGGMLGLIGLVTPDDPFTGTAEGTVGIPGIMISQRAADELRAGLPDGVHIRFDMDNRISAAGTIVGSSSRGPSMNDVIVKPEIGAPGASVSAVAGSGDAVDRFGGTSGATPMVAGSAALLLDARPSLTPRESKALLMNTAYTGILTTPKSFGGVLAPISRIGAGEVRPEPAIAAEAAAWDSALPSAALSFGLVDVTGTSTLQRSVTVKNYTGAARTYTVSTDVRDPAKAGGPVSLSVPSTVTVPANGQTHFTVTMTIDGSRLPTWTGDSGYLGTAATWLTDMEFDGYVMLAPSAGQLLHVPWHVLPRRSADIGLDGSSLVNRGVGVADTYAMGLIGTSPDQPRGGAGQGDPRPDLRAAGYRVDAVPADYCGKAPSWVLSFGISTWERQTHGAYPAAVQLFLDTDRDGKADYSVISEPIDFTDGRLVTKVVDLAEARASVASFGIHATNSGSRIISMCAEDIGMSARTPIDVSTKLWESYFFGILTDELPTTTIDLAAPKHTVTFGGEAAPVLHLQPGGRRTLAVSRSATSPSEDQGVLLLNIGGTTPSGELIVLASAAAPTDVAATPTSSGAQLRWAAPVSLNDAPVTGYSVEASINGGATWSTLLANTGSTQTAASVGGLDPAKGYVFRVAALNMFGAGTPSLPSAPVSPIGPAGPPTGVTAVAGVGSATVSWTAPVQTGGSPITGYRVEVSGGTGSWSSAIANTGSAATSVAVSGLGSGTYRFRVSALTSAGVGATSEPSAPVTVEVPAPVTPPGKVKRLAASAVARTIRVTWSVPTRDGGSPVTSYVVQIRRGSGAWTSVGTPRQTRLRVGKLQAGKYRVRVAAVNVVGQGAWTVRTSIRVR